MNTEDLSNEELVALCRSGGESAGAAARDQLVSNFSGMVNKVASTFTWSGSLEAADLVQEGFVGLLKAIENYDPEKASFSTYAYTAIRGEIARTIANESRTVRLPVHLHKECARLARHAEGLRREKGRNPDDFEIAESMGIGVERVRKLRVMDQGVHVPFEEAEEMGMLEWGSGRRVPPHQGCE